MTGREAYDIYFNTVDVFRDEGTTEEEFSRFFNTAQYQLLDEDLSVLKGLDLREQRNIELTQQIYSQWTPCIHEDLPLTASASGVAGYQSLNTNFPNTVIRDNDGVIETKKPQLRHIMSVAREDSGGVKRPCKWVRFNDKEVVEGNPFRKGTERWPWYYQGDTSIYVYPESAAQLSVSVLREPIHMWFESVGSGNNVDPELPDSTCHRVIKRAIHLTGVNIREPFLAQVND